MNITSLANSINVCSDSEYVKGGAFKKTAMGGFCFLVSNFCAGFGQSVYNCAHFCRFECRSPHICSA